MVSVLVGIVKSYKMFGANFYPVVGQGIMRVTFSPRREAVHGLTLHDRVEGGPMSISSSLMYYFWMALADSADISHIVSPYHPREAVP